MKFLLILQILFYTQLNLFGQKEYKYHYNKHLIKQQSTFSSNQKDTTIELDRSCLLFQIRDINEKEIPFAKISIKGVSTDTIILSDYRGLASVNLPARKYSISIIYSLCSPIILDSFEANSNSVTTIKASLGKSNSNLVAIISSQRKLTKEEIKKIVFDLSNENEDNELIKNKICIVEWEI
jgi:hypothetical protein